MAAESLVINTGPLILLEKARALEIAGRLPFQFVCPMAVRRELDAGVAAGYPDLCPEWRTVMQLAAPLSPLTKAALDEGEAEVIQLAIERNFRQVCLDDLRGRRMALASGLQVVGALGLLVSAKRLGIIPALAPFTDRLMSAGAWYSPDLIKRVLAAVAE